MSRNYKYGFADQLLIHAQRPDASACAGYDVWTGRMGRYVRRGAKGIALVDNSGDSPKLRYVFDVSDTGARRGSRPFEPWQVDSESTNVVASALDVHFGVEPRVSLAEQLEVVAAQLADEYWLNNSGDILGIVDGSFLEGYDEFTVGVKFRNAAVVSLTHSLLTRCGFEPDNYLTPENFEDVFEWNTSEAASALGMAVSSINQTVLREIERSIRSYERSLHNDRNNLQNSERRANPEPEPARDVANRPVREDAPALSQGAPSGAVEPAHSDGDAVRAPARDRDSGAEPHRPYAAETRGGGGRDGDTKSRRPNEVDGPHEQLQRASRRSSSERVNLQLNLFEAEDAQAPSAFSCLQEVIDAVLRVGENTSYLRERVAAEFEKQRSLDEIAAFLPTVYRGGVGVSVDGEHYSAWMNTDGIRIAQGNAARYEHNAQIIPWSDAAERISELLNTGQYAGSWELERSAATERELLAQQIVYLYRDLVDGQENSLFPSLNGIKNGLFPDVTERVAAMLADHEQCETLLNEYRNFLAAYRADRSVLRFHYHRTNEMLNSLESQLLPRVQFHADAEIIPSPHQFITQDEIDKLLCDGGITVGGKWRIFRLFTEEHSTEDKADFLKREYGIGGRSHALSDAPGSDESHDAKGMTLSKGGCENVSLTWRQIARRIDELIASDRFMTALELAVYDTHTAAYAQYNRAKPYHDGDIVLVQFGGAFYTYGADAETAAHALGQRTRQAGGLDYVEIMEEQIEPALDSLRAYKPVTLNYENGTELTVDFHLPNERREQYEQRLYEALMASDYYADAVMNSDAENATLTGERVLREFAAASTDRDFQRAYYDNPGLRETLNRAALDAAYHDLSEPPAEDEPAVMPRDPLAPAYNVGDFVWVERRQFEITDIQNGDVELMQTGLDVPIYRSESKEYFEQYIKQDARNRQIADFLSVDLDDERGQVVAGMLTDDDRAQIARWLRDGEGNTQISERLEALLSVREGVEPDGLHYSIPDDNGNIVVAGFVPWEQLAEALRGMLRDDPEAFEHVSSSAVDQPEVVSETDTKFQEKTVAYYDAEKAHLPYDVVFQTIGSASESEPTQPEPSVSPETPRNFHKSATGANDVNAYNTYGTQRMNAYKILENTLNLRDVRVYDKVVDVDGTERRVLNSKETTLAQQKQQVIKDAFKDWLWKDQQRRQTLVAKYNELFNSIKPREYDGSHLTFPGMNPEIELRQHQRDAIARILYGGNTLLAHEVGAGKTFTMAAAAMEAKRLGLCSKPMFVTPNHLTGQWASEFLRLYPSANILVTTKKDFEKANRQKFCARIATGGYDAVIIGHSQFEKIPVSQERQEMSP